jgi:hypothetical protein
MGRSSELFAKLEGQRRNSGYYKHLDDEHFYDLWLHEKKFSVRVAKSLRPVKLFFEKGFRKIFPKQPPF